MNLLMEASAPPLRIPFRHVVVPIPEYGSLSPVHAPVWNNSKLHSIFWHFSVFVAKRSAFELKRGRRLIYGCCGDSLAEKRVGDCVHADVKLHAADCGF
jgi:hypothetical protein